MGDSPTEIVERLSEYVDELIDAREKQKELAIKGRTQMILTALKKLRAAHKRSKLPKELITRIQEEKTRSGLKLPDTYSNYYIKRSDTYSNHISFCWSCYNRIGIKVTVDSRVHSVCSFCSWVQCPDCGACRPDKYGGCNV